MSTKTEGQHTAEFLVSESPGHISRSQVEVTVPTGATLAPGTVLAKLSASGKYVPYDNAGSDGSEVAAAVLYGELENTDESNPADMDATVIDFGAEVRKSDLQWAAGLNDGDKTAAYADLAANGVKARA